MKNRSEYSSSNKSKHAYWISMYEIPSYIDIRTQKAMIYSGAQQHGYKRINLKKALEKDPTILYNAFNMAYNGEKLLKNINDSRYDDLNTDFLFIDLDNKVLDKNGFAFNVNEYDDVKRTLDDSNLNYVLCTSSNHMQPSSANPGELVPKMHILIPCLKPNLSPEQVKMSLNVLKEIFPTFEFDPATSGFSQNKGPSHPDTFRCDYRFDKHDFDLGLPIAEIKRLKIEHDMNKRRGSLKAIDVNRESDYVRAFNSQIDNLYGMRIAWIGNQNIQLYRDKDDSGPGCFYYPENPNYPSNLIFDNQTNGKKNGKEARKTYEILFNLNDYKDAHKPDDIREDAKKEVSSKLDDFFHESFMKPKVYGLAAEGLGKSRTTLEKGKEHNFIYCVDTRVKLDEVEDTLKSLSIEYARVLSSNEIVEEFGQNRGLPNLGDDYNAFRKMVFQNNIGKPRHLHESASISEFASWAKVTYNNVIFDELKHIYDTNNRMIHLDMVVIMTTAKLQTMLYTRQGNIHDLDKPIIFDEFPEDMYDEYIVRESELNDDYQDMITLAFNRKIKSNWNKDSEFWVYKRESLRYMIAPYAVLILSTEKSILEAKLSHFEYRELFNLQYKLMSPNVNYWLTESTSKRKEDNSTILEKIIEEVEGELGYNVITDGAGRMTHRSAKGRNDLNQDNIIIGTLSRESKVLEFQLNSVFYKDTYKKVEHRIQTILMENQVQQSIGRNSGFRYTSHNAVVVLPLLSGSAKNRMRFEPEFRYVSPNVYRLIRKKKAA